MEMPVMKTIAAGRIPGDWIPYEAEGEGYVPVERWGRDHWSTLAYLETRAVDHGGVIKNANMRTHARLHREFVGILFGGEIQDGSAYPTRLKDGELTKHDDWSCLEGAVAAGLLRAYFRVKDHCASFGNSEARVEFTEAGQAVCAQLRAHKANGGSFATFIPSTAVAA